MATAGGTVVNSTSTAYAPNQHSVTVTSGTGGGAVTTISFTDTFGNPVLTQYNPTNQFTLQTYDRTGALVSSRDELGQTTTLGYDGLGRLALKTLPDGAINRLTYDALGNVTTNEFPNGMRWRALYDDKGRMRTNWLVNGSTATRTNTVTYRTTGAIGLVDTTTDGRGITFTNIYDPWLRVTNRTAGTFALSYDYDVLGRTRLIQQSSGGQVSRVDRTFDNYSQTTLETVTLDGNTFSQFGQQWDGAGRRTTRYQAANPLVQGLGYGDTAAFTWRADGLLASITQGGLTSTYGYTNNGLILGRTNAWRQWAATARDTRGRLTQASLKVGGSSVLAETLNWRADSKLDDYTADRTGGSTWDETRDYSYNSRGQLTGETFKPSAGGNATNTFGYDTGKLGVRTSANLSGSLVNTWSGGTPDVLGRLTSESITQSQWFLTARGRAPGALSVALTLDGSAQGMDYDASNPDGLWESPLSFGTTPNPHVLIATATHPFNGGTGGTNAYTKTTNNFTASGSGTVTVAYDGNGNVTSRTWNGTNPKSQALEWDELGRLVRVTEKFGSTTNLVWTATYDGLSRRLRVTEVRPGVVGTAVIDSWYDPQVEFLEAAVSYNGERWWQIYGPDLGGVYGASHGIGGLEGAIRERDGANEGLLTDTFGHGIATVTGTTVSWQTTQLGGYGVVQGYDAPKLSYNVSPMRAALYRGRRTDATGFVSFGLRPYDPLEGRFLAPDSLGHDTSWSLYDYAGNDPINGLDPDGRYAYDQYKNGGNTGRFLNSLAYGLNNYSGDNVLLSGLAGFTGSLASMGAGMVTPATYVNGAVHFAENTGSIYSRAVEQGDSGWSAGYQAGGYALGSAVGLTQFYEGYNGIDLGSAEEIDDVDRASRMLSGGGQLLLTGVGGAALVEGITKGGASIGAEQPLSPDFYPVPDPPMSAPPVRYTPRSLEEVFRMREGNPPIPKSAGDWIEGHHRQQVPLSEGGVIDELWWRTHRGKGNHSRHNQPSRLTDQQRARELREYYKSRGAEYMTGNGEGI